MQHGRLQMPPIVSPPVAKVVCPICNKLFASKKSMQNHRKVSLEGCVCSECGQCAQMMHVVKRVSTPPTAAPPPVANSNIPSLAPKRKCVSEDDENNVDGVDTTSPPVKQARVVSSPRRTSKGVRTASDTTLTKSLDCTTCKIEIKNETEKVYHDQVVHNRWEELLLEI